MPCDGKNLTEISATLSTGYKTAANIVPAAKLKLHPVLTLVEFTIGIEQNAVMPRNRARLLHPLGSWRILLFYAARAGSEAIDPAGSRATAAVNTTRIPAEGTLVSDAAGSRTA